MDSKIDFVITWVDGNDLDWRKEKNKYVANKEDDDRDVRYRDWDNLQYWFRGVEKFAPWVNKIHFVTWGHIPKWLNINNPKLNIVKHEDFIPKEYLPTFCSNAIEVNLHRINGLSNQFVYFNDDIFITNYVKPTNFFKNGKPCDMAVFNPIVSENPVFANNLNTVVRVLNKNFNIHTMKKENLGKYLNLKYGMYNIRTLLCLPYNGILGFKETHNCNPFLKDTFEKVWEKEFDILDKTSKSKFRTSHIVNQYVFKYWQYCEGNFVPQHNIKKIYNIFKDFEKIYKAIKKQKYKLICLNEDKDSEDFETVKEEIIKSFNTILPEKCSFEK